MPIETYEQALTFWHGRVNYEQRGMPTDLRELKLDRMLALLERLGNPHQGLKIVHVAGSKGKGSTAAMLAMILRCAGHRTGLFTSPHLCRVEERVQVDGVPIRAEDLLQRMQEIEPAVRALDAVNMPPTFFEIVTALGFMHFARERVDLAVIEVGLGGRFDSTNVCTPLVSVITSISLDHTQQLGDTLSEIAREKAGIIKPDVPVVHGVEAEDVRAVIDAVGEEVDAEIFALGADFKFRHTSASVKPDEMRLARVALKTWMGQWPAMEMKLLGRHQAANAAVAVATVELLRQFRIAIPDRAVFQGLREVVWPARVEVLSQRPLVVLDCAHNVASIEALVETLNESFPVTRRLLIFAGSRDKDLEGMLGVLVPHFERAFCTRYQGSTRGADAAELAQIWTKRGGQRAEVHATPAMAWQAAISAARPDDLIVITGSVFLAGELRPLLVSQPAAAS
jgi:dihydrofolate synthase/folylpolyglutamate synthase